ncbi:hypothetical protein SNE40_015590 [Patella caerulea]|uniref:Ras association domain-containing protein 1 n=1 Tax=Patella caerulea TaxID=87958 RepID=A0AAN8JMI0_PATCE
MEDSGYRTSFSDQDLKISETCSKLSQPNGIFSLNFNDLKTSPTYSYLQHGFEDEEDFEDFKQELKDFRRLKHEVKEESQKFEIKNLQKNELKRCEISNISKHRDKGVQNSYYDNIGHTDFSGFRELPVSHFPNRTSKSSRDFKRISDAHNRRSRSVDLGETAQLSQELYDTKFSSLARKKLQDDFQDFKLSNLSGLSCRRKREKYNMDPLTFDDHFQEFERVYETIHSRRTSADLEKYHPMDDSDDEDDDEVLSKDKRGGMMRPSSRFSSNSSLNDVFSIDFDEAFSDFFNTDEDFVEFEREFERSRLNRRSRAIHDFKRMSSCDIFSDVKSYCDRNKASAIVEKRPSLPCNVLATEQNFPGLPDKKTRDTSSINMWNSLEDWDYVLNKLKRNSRLFTDGSEFWDTSCQGTSGSSRSDRLSVESCMCRKSKDCQYTCHHTCVPSVTLDCTPVSPTEVPSTPDGNAAETSLSDRKPIISPRPPIPAILEEKVCNHNSEHQEATPLLPPDADQTNESDETDSGYRSGTIPDEKLPKHKGQATLNREELQAKLLEYNKHVPSAVFEPDEGAETFQGFLKVTLNFIRPITMSLGVRPPSIYEMLTKEHIVEQNTQSIAFYMPRDTVKSIHTSSSTTTKEVIAALLKKFHIIDHPRKFAMYEQEFDGHKIVKLRRVTDKEYPLHICLNWDPEHLKRYRLVLQENETGEIVWDGFSLPELNNFLIVLSREENEYISQLQYKYKIMRRIITQRLKEIRKERRRLSGATSPTGSSSPSTPKSSSGGFTPPANNS